MTTKGYVCLEDGTFVLNCDSSTSHLGLNSITFLSPAINKRGSAEQRHLVLNFSH
ncbi:hypothetical protein X975_17758, partial [Stegodyphus mimosarum]